LGEPFFTSDGVFVQAEDVDARPTRRLSVDVLTSVAIALDLRSPSTPSKTTM